MAEKFVPNFKTKYINEVVPALQKDFAFKTQIGRASCRERV